MMPAFGRGGASAFAVCGAASGSACAAGAGWMCDVRRPGRHAMGAASRAARTLQVSAAICGERTRGGSQGSAAARWCGENAADGQRDGTTEDETARGAEEFTELSRLEIRVGKVIECEPHPDADSLYIEKIDVGENEPRTIVSGLVQYISADELKGRSVVVLCNLKPRAMRGVTSAGMLLCASNADHTDVDPLAPPEGAAVGELIRFQGHKAEPMEAGNRASKAFSKVAESFRTNDDGVAVFESTPFSTTAGPCFSPKKLVGTVS